MPVKSDLASLGHLGSSWWTGEARRQASVICIIVQLDNHRRASQSVHTTSSFWWSLITQLAHCRVCPSTVPGHRCQISWPAIATRPYNCLLNIHGRRRDTPERRTDDGRRVRVRVEVRLYVVQSVLSISVHLAHTGTSPVLLAGCLATKTIHVYGAALATVTDSYNVNLAPQTTDHHQPQPLVMRPSLYALVRPSVVYGLSTRKKQKKTQARKTQIGVNFTQTRSNRADNIIQLKMSESKTLVSHQSE